MRQLALMDAIQKCYYRQQHQASKNRPNTELCCQILINFIVDQSQSAAKN